ncbi:hypothetical protein [Nocardioides sp. InS609-2]|uniref:hypothetical protein n=1 Tax=Nocardioides sp. InS609-2 TaxID=2760705 RepID=UPI0020BE8C6B|nr:hypothetical protein [Nocardioides sp. InS609-2]
MSQQTIKQRARRAARGMAERRRRERAERERGIEDLAVQVMTAIGERDAAVAEAERRAGGALWEMTEVAGLSLSEAVAWCGEQISVREATRLRRLVDRAAKDVEPAAGKGVPATGSGGAGAVAAAR